MSKKTIPPASPAGGVALSVLQASLNHSAAYRSSQTSPLGDSFPDDSCLPADGAAPDHAGEDDWTYFIARPHLRTRIRTAFPGEFPRKILKKGRGRTAVVIVAVSRDATGQPTTRARGVLFPEGGTA
jgi:hypothetical protein